MNRDAFLKRWRSMGTTRQLAVLLTALVKREANGEVSISMDALDDIDSGQSVVYREVNGEIRLLFSGEFTTLYVIEDQVHQRGNQWPTQAASVPSYNSPMKTDEELAEIEERTTAAGRLRDAARRARVEPLTTTERRPGTPHRRPTTPEEELQ